MNKLLLLAISLLLLAAKSFSQPICGFDSMHARLLKDPSYRKQIDVANDNIRTYINKHRTQLEARVSGVNATLYYIPVVVHVLHTGGAVGSIYNPTDAQITDAIAYLNEVYNGTYTGTQGVGDLQIQFVLAQRDPNCNPTNGINRINASSLSGYAANGVNYSNTTGASDASVKSFIHWSSTSYYNIWIVDKIDGKDGTSGQFIAGYAQFPGNSASTDGTVMLATQMKRGQKTLPHEIGHALFLYHVFQGSPDKNTCPTNTFNDCTKDGDFVCDTDPITYNQTGGVVDFTCRTGTNGCTGTAFNINTESNYMNYTNCYTLFTLGQKNRMLATLASASDRVSLTTSLGGTPTYDATNPCSPKIDFEFTEDQQTETTAATSGCRSYKDYTYNMVIGSNPSAAATATLNIASGTAVEGVDFDITTNGSFTSPSKTLTFPTGGHANQSFTIRVYDDATVESTESLTLGFTVSNGGGNAVKGDGRINLTLTIIDNDTAPVGPFSATKTLGGYTNTLQSPFAGMNAKQKSELLYRASELTAAGLNAGNITGLALNILKNTAAGFVYQGLTIKMGNSSVNSFTPVSDASYTTVYSGNYSTVNGLNSFTFSTPFTWDGVSNVVVVICYDNGATTDPANDNCQGYAGSVGTGGVSYVFQSTINCSGSFSSYNLYNSDLRPNIQFVYADPGTQVQTVLNGSNTLYLGPNADVYFYDPSSSKLIARINNTTSFDYGCTQVFIDRNNTSAGANTVAFWNNTPANYLLSKTIKVIPTTNNPSGAYQISLYYTQAEINAWQTATGQSVSNIELVKVASQISDVTPANPSGGGTVTKVTPAVTTFGTNTVITGSFTNGFSGFGAGITGNSALPVTLLDFSGVLRSAAAVLNWSTSSEINSSYFDIERSYDGVSFVKVGAVTAAGNSSSIKSYSFTDQFLQEHNYYRLKQVDIDGHFVYSKTILVDYQQYNGNFRIINNPFTDVLEIDFGKVQSGKTAIRLLDVTGKEIYHVVNDATGQSRIKINLSGRNISAGIYLLQVTSNKQEYIERVMKR